MKPGLGLSITALIIGVQLTLTAQDRSRSGNQMTLASAAFKDGQAIPAKYTCDGKDISPSLAWKETPAGTKTFALIVEDPDAPAGTWVHWIVYNLPPGTQDLREDFPARPRLPDGMMQGKNDFGRTGYGGPCPPSGTHRYFFHLYALDTVLSLPPDATAQQLRAAMKDHVLAQAQLIGRYRKK